MKDSSDFIGKYIKVVTATETEIEGTLIAIETNGILLQDIVEANNDGDKEIFYFFPSGSIDHLFFDSERDY